MGCICFLVRKRPVQGNRVGIGRCTFLIKMFFSVRLPRSRCASAAGPWFGNPRGLVLRPRIPPCMSGSGCTAAWSSTGRAFLRVELDLSGVLARVGCRHVGGQPWPRSHLHASADSPTQCGPRECGRPCFLVQSFVALRMRWLCGCPSDDGVSTIIVCVWPGAVFGHLFVLV